MNPFRADLAGALCAVLFLMLPMLITGRNDISALDFVLSMGVIVPLAWRRVRPVLSGSITALFCLVYVWVSGMPEPADFVLLAAPLFTVYSLAAHAPRWASLIGLAAAGTGCVFFVFSVVSHPSGNEGPGYAFDIAAFEAIVLAAWTLGALARTRRLAMGDLQDRARRHEAERQQERDLAAADERTHIAREMHDIVAHSLSVVITQADGARYASVQDPQLAATALGTIAETGRGSLHEMRRLLGVLRGGELASTRPLPSLADVGELVDAVKRAGLDVSVRESGTMRRRLPAGAELSAYRVVQESFTNILKHAGPQAKATVDLVWTSRGLEIIVHDDGGNTGADGLQPGPAAIGSGQGINGMAERVALYAGTVHAGPAPGGGFRVAAFVPYTEV